MFLKTKIFQLLRKSLKMLYTKDGYPEVNENVLCTVTRIYGNTVFVQLNEYEKEGVLTISEIAPGRIRNLREHVVENKVIVCKVLRVDKPQNRIDVSLRRVPIQVMKEKLEEIKKEEYADKIYTDIAKEFKITKEELFEKTYEPIFEEYSTVFEALYVIMIDNEKIKMFSNLNKKEKDLFVKIINDRIKPEEITFKKKFKLKSLIVDGVDKIKLAIKNSVEPLKYDKIQIVYLAAGEFGVTIIHDDMKSADMLFNKFKQNLTNHAKELKLELEIN